MTTTTWLWMTQPGSSWAAASGGGRSVVPVVCVAVSSDGHYWGCLVGGIVSRAGEGVRESARGEQGGRCLRGNSPYGPLSGTQYACIQPHRLDSFVTVARSLRSAMIQQYLSHIVLLTAES